MKKIFFLTIAIIISSVVAYQYKNALLDKYFDIAALFYWDYEKDKQLISPYFDEDFYKKEYSPELKRTGDEPIKHFLVRSMKLGGGHFDPNPWFNVTIYKERLWPCKDNPFVNFLKQPPLKVDKAAPVVAVYANHTQIQRAWMAVEEFLRRQKFQVKLILPRSFENSVPPCFKPMIDRGLLLEFSDDPQLSFYHSPFINYPEQYQVNDLTAVEVAPPDQAITRFKKGNKDYVMHRLYNYTGWQKNGRINPCVINFAHYCFEPVEFSKFGHDGYTFKKSMQRLSPLFDLMLINYDIQTPNLRIIPGYLHLNVDPKEVDPVKKYEVSFMLSMGGKDFSSFKTRGTFVYHYRKIIWDEEKRFPLPTLFYLSRKDMNKYPKELRDRAMPTSSRKWIFNSQFSLAFENSIQENFLSEKLLDCFMCMSIPIYIGCPNVTDYFDVRGMFIAKDPEDVIRIANTITPETYNKMLPYLKENKIRAERLLKLEDHEIEKFFAISVNYNL